MLLLSERLRTVAVHPLSAFVIVAGGLLYALPQITNELCTGISVYLFSRVLPGGKK